MKKLVTKISTVVKIALVLLTITTFSCSKSDDSPDVVTSSFTTAYNGIYNGNGVDGSGTPFNGSITLNVTSGSTANITGEAGNYSISEIQVSAGGGFIGKISAGSSISLAFSGTNSNTIDVGGPFSFNGTK